MIKISKIELGRGASFLSLEIIIGIFSGYFFWFILSRLTTTEVIGTAGVVVSFTSIFIVIALMAINNGSQRFLGKSFADKDLSTSKLLIKASMLLVSIGVVASTIFILIFRDWLTEYFEIDLSLMLLAIIIIISSSFHLLFRSIIVSSLKTQRLPTIMTVSAVAKIVLAILLVWIGTGAWGIVFGFAIFEILTASLLAMNIFLIVKNSSEKTNTSIVFYTKNIFNASFVSWVPALIMTFGTNLGTIVVFGSQGASLAGVYFIAFSISSAITLLMGAPLGVTFPKLSSMNDGRKKLAWRITKISLVAFLPITMSLIPYSENILQLFGQDYGVGEFTLEILLYSMLPITVASGVRILIYAYGNYRQVLAIGIGTSIPRIILYFILVPIYGSEGAGLSFTVGSIIGFLVSIIIAKKIGMKIFWKELAAIFAIPLVLSFIFSYFGINFVIGIIFSILLSYIIYTKLKIFAKEDVEDTIEILPSRLAQPSKKIIYFIGNKLKLFS